MMPSPDETLPDPFSKFHVAVAAEAIAAAQFARCGVDVSVQYGANQPEYDLIVRHRPDGLMMAVSVKGSKDGSWGLTQKLLKDTKYHAAIDTWVEKHKSTTIFCFVQFKGVKLDQLPRCYLATPVEVALVMKAVAKGKGGTILYEKHAWTKKALGAGTTEQIPDYWALSPERVMQLLRQVNSKATMAS